MLGAIPPLPQCICLAWCLVENRNNFTNMRVSFGTVLPQDEGEGGGGEWEKDKETK
jgi:hypothetical protein